MGQHWLFGTCSIASHYLNHCRHTAKLIFRVKFQWHLIQKATLPTTFIHVLMNKGILISLYYPFAYPYFIYCNHVWGNTYPSYLERMVLLQKRLVRVITCSHYRAHTEPLVLANILLSLQDMHLYITGIFMNNYVTQKLPHIFENYFEHNKDVHELNTSQANGFHVPFSRLQVRRFSIKIHGSEVWNSFPTYIKKSTSVMVLKKLRKYLVDRHLLVTVTQFW